MDEPFIIKILLYSLGSILGAIGFGVRYVLNKLKEIVPESEIRQIIRDQAAPTDMQLKMIYERQAHIERKLDNLLEMFVVPRRNTDS